MNIQFHPDKKNYIDNKGNEIFKLVSSRKSFNVAPSNKFSPDFQKMAIVDLGIISDPIDYTKENLRGEVIEKFRNIKDIQIGLEIFHYPLVEKLAKDILKDAEINKLVTQNYLAGLIFDWLIKKYLKTNEDDSLAEWIIKCYSLTNKERYYFIPILFLKSNVTFNIGPVEFKTFTENYIKQLSNKLPIERRNDFIEAMSNHQMILFGNCKILGENKKGLEIASDNISLAVDVIRILSPTIEIPEFKLFFDVDFRNPHQSKHEHLIQNASAPEEISININIEPRPFVLSQSVWKNMVANGFNEIHEFLSKSIDRRTELVFLIFNGIRNFSKAIGTHDLNERVVIIYTVLESLLLPNDSSPIVDSVSKYLPRLITKDFDQRKSIIEMVKIMYQVRSAMVHHGIKKKFEISNLVLLQICTRSLILKFVEISKTKENKKIILQEIDDIILKS
jgi:hypothetical protein